MRCLAPALILLLALAACQPAPAAALVDPTIPPTDLPTHTPVPTATAPPTATLAPTLTATPWPTATPTPWYDQERVEWSIMSTVYGNRLIHPVELVYYLACRDIDLRCQGDCTDQVILSLPTDSPRGLLYTSNYTPVDLVPLDPAVPHAPSMDADYVPMLNAAAAEALRQFVLAVKEETGEQIYVMHTYRPYSPYDPLGAGASQHQTGLAADLYISHDGGHTLRSVMEIENIYALANRFGWVRAFDFEDPHFLYLDGPAPGLTMALIQRGVRLNANQYAVTNALIAAFQTLTDTIPEEIRAQMALPEPTPTP